uniref:Rho-GAP domain-containing protein n=1 Tax=Macrostomum lignano TaxID=282301 RepID=A0A1I8I8P5_9PLAT
SASSKSGSGHSPAPESRPGRLSRAACSLGIVGSGSRRAHSVDALDGPATPPGSAGVGGASPPVSATPGKLSTANSLDLESAVFSVTVERAAAGPEPARTSAGTAASLSQTPPSSSTLAPSAAAGSYSIDAWVRVDRDASLTVLPVSGEQQQLTVGIGRDCSTSYKRRKLRLTTPDWQLVFPSAAASHRPGSYGVPLHLCPMGPDGVPLIVQLCCRVLEAAGLRREGVYRVSGNARNIEALEAELAKPPHEMDPACELWLEHNVVASVLKRFLLQLPDPLIPAVYYNDFVSAQQLHEHSGRMLKLHRLLSMMEEHAEHPQHKCHRRTLQYLVGHLARVAQLSASNRMRVYNLAMVFARLCSASGPRRPWSPTLLTSSASPRPSS